jgi:hypothetical protein
MAGKKRPAKNPAAVELGRRGGQKKVAKGYAVLTPAERAERAREGAKARWTKKRKKSGDK